jgi:hypothetical protein
MNEGTILKESPIEEVRTKKSSSIDVDFANILEKKESSSVHVTFTKALNDIEIYKCTQYGSNGNGSTYTTSAVEKSEDIYDLKDICLESLQTYKFYLSEKNIDLEYFIPLQKWEGTVIKVNENTFFARLIDLTDRDGPDEEGEFSKDEVSKIDLELLSPGAIFYWTIGYLDRSSGRKRESILRFRRKPIFVKKHFDKAKDEARKLRDFIEWK